MNEELEGLLCDLREVRESEDECLPNFGNEGKAQVIAFLEGEIERLRGLVEEDTFDYEDGELEQERHDLCLSLGIARYC